MGASVQRNGAMRLPAVELLTQYSRNVPFQQDDILVLSSGKEVRIFLGSFLFRA
jgi:hypothetical protein